jgi:hypothetical protein
VSQWSKRMNKRIWWWYCCSGALPPLLKGIDKDFPMVLLLRGPSSTS